MRGRDGFSDLKVILQRNFQRCYLFSCALEKAERRNIAASAERTFHNTEQIREIRNCNNTRTINGLIIISPQTNLSMFMVSRSWKVAFLDNLLFVPFTQATSSSVCPRKPLANQNIFSAAFLVQKVWNSATKLPAKHCLWGTQNEFYIWWVVWQVCHHINAARKNTFNGIH